MESQFQGDLFPEWLFEATPDFGFDTQLQSQSDDMLPDYYPQPVATGLIQADFYHNLPGVSQDPCVYADNVADVFHDPIVPDSGFTIPEMTYHQPTLYSNNPGASATEFGTTSSSLSSCSSSDGYDFSFNSPISLGGTMSGFPETMLASFPSADLMVAPVMLENHPMTASTSLPQHVTQVGQQSRQIESTTTAAQCQNPLESIEEPQTPLIQTETSKKVPKTTPRSRIGRPRNPKREWRMKHRPEKCPECGKGFPFVSEWKRHFRDKHPDEATPKYGVSTERFYCKQCPKSYKRSERLRGHERKKHARAIDRRASQPQSQAPEGGDKSPALEEGRLALKRLCPRGS